MQIFEVYKGIIAVFSVPDEQKDVQTELIEPPDIERFPVPGEIRDDKEFTAAGSVTNGFHLGKVSQEVLAVVLANLLGFAADAPQDFDAGNDVVAIEPCLEGILGAAEQNGTVALLGEDAVEIVYPECDATPSKERKRDKEARAHGEKGKTREIRQAIHGIFNGRTLRKISKCLITRDCQDIQRH